MSSTAAVSIGSTSSAAQARTTTPQCVHPVPPRVPDWSQRILETVTDGRTVVARMRCTGTHQGQWQGLEPTGRMMRVDEVYFFRIRHERIAGLWGLEDTWTRMRQLAGDDVTLGELGSLSEPRQPPPARGRAGSLVTPATSGGD